MDRRTHSTLFVMWVTLTLSIVLVGEVRDSKRKDAELKQLRQAIAQYHTPLPAEQESE